MKNAAEAMEHTLNSKKSQDSNKKKKCEQINSRIQTQKKKKNEA